MNDQLFEEFCLKHTKKLRQYCLYLMNNNFADAEDLVQESFIRFYTRFFAEQKIQDEGVLSSTIKAIPYSYLKRIAENTRYEWYRKNRNFKNVEPVDESHEALQIPDGINLNSRIDFEELRRKSCLKLDPIERRIFFARYLEGHNHKEIASRFSISVPVVKHKLAQAKNKLRSE